MGNTPFELTGADPADPHPAFGNILYESNRAANFRAILLVTLWNLWLNALQLALPGGGIQ